MENSLEVFQKNLKIRVATWTSNPTPGHILGQTYSSKGYSILWQIIMEKNIKKNIYIIYITESFSYTAEINTTL